MANHLDIQLSNYNQQNGKYNFARGPDGDVAFDTTRAHAVMTSIIEKRNTYPFSRNHGSELYKLRSATSKTPSQAEALALDALLELERDREITNPSATATLTRQSGASRLSLDVAWNTPGGVPVSATTNI